MNANGGSFDGYSDVDDFMIAIVLRYWWCLRLRILSSNLSKMSLTYVVSNIRHYIDVVIFDNNNDWNLFKIAFGPFKSVSIRNPDKDRLFSTKKMV